MAEKVGEIYYEIALDTKELIDDQRKVDRELKKTSGSLEEFGAKLTAAAAAVAALAAAMAAIKVAKLADEFRLLGARVEVAAGSVESGSAAFSDLVKISRQTQSSLAGNIEVFTRLNQSILQMGGTQRDTLQLTELLAKAIKVSGASADEAKSAMLQFGQALGSGKLAGDELGSLLESAPYLMRQLADGIGVPVGALKKLGEEGKLTADVVTNALSNAAQKIDADFKKFPQTIESAMQVSQDSAALAALKFDELAGISQTLTGLTKGLGDVLENLAGQLGAANTEAGALGRNKAISSWADSTRNSLSYLIDAADLVWQTVSVLGRNVAYVFTGIGTEIGGIGAQVKAVLRGDLAGAMAIRDAMVADASARRRELDAADARTTGRAKLAGQAMRDAWNQGAGGGRGFVNPAAGMSTLKSPTTPDEKKKKTGQTFDSAAYLSSLRLAQASEIGAINEKEAEKLRLNKRHLDEKKLSEAEYAEAVKTITQTAEDDRIALMAKTQEKIDKQREDDTRDAKTALDKRNQDIKAAADYALNLTKAIDPIAALTAEYQAKLELVTQYEAMMQAAKTDATAQGELARTQITNEFELQRRALAEQSFRSQGEAQAFLIDSINSLSSTATSSITGLIQGTMTAQDALRGLASTVLNEAVGALVQMGVQYVKNALLEKTLAASKGVTYAASISAQVAGMSALAAQNAFAATAAIPIIGPALAPAAAAAAGAAATGLGAPAIATAPLAGARQYGGPVSAGSLYRVNETGMPEMFTGANGNQYMLPTKSGQVTAADKVGGQNQAPTVIIQNMGTPQQVQSQSYDQQTNTLKMVTADLISQVSNNQGPFWNALRGSTNVRGAL